MYFPVAGDPQLRPIALYSKKKYKNEIGGSKKIRAARKLLS